MQASKQPCAAARFLIFCTHWYTRMSFYIYVWNRKCVAFISYYYFFYLVLFVVVVITIFVGILNLCIWFGFAWILLKRWKTNKLTFSTQKLPFDKCYGKSFQNPFSTFVSLKVSKDEYIWMCVFLRFLIWCLVSEYDCVCMCMCKIVNVFAYTI